MRSTLQPRRDPVEDDLQALPEGRPDAEIAGYLTRWALLGEAEAAALVPSLRPSAMGVYVLAYHHGHRILDDLPDGPDPRRLLTEQVLPSDLG